MNQMETEYVFMTIKDGLFEMTYKPLKLVDIGIAKVIVKERLEFKGGVNYPCLFDVSPVKEITKEARDYMANEGNDFVLASALLINSPLLKMMGNFFITVNKPKNPTKLFNNKDEALQWLQQFK